MTTLIIDGGGYNKILDACKADNDFRGGNYFIENSYYGCFCFVTYTGYANTTGSLYGHKYTKRWKVIFNKSKFDEQGLY